MKKLLSLALLCAFAIGVKAQKTTTQAFGKISKEDLELKACDFESDANAEVLFDKGSVVLNGSFELAYERHIRIKIFNDKAKDIANIKIIYWGGHLFETLSGLEAQTINLNNGNIEVTKIDRKQIYKKDIDKFLSEATFAFPNVQPGSIIEYKYTISSKSIANFPDWYFQTGIPTRYSELSIELPNSLHYKTLQMVRQPFVVNNENTKAMANIPSLRVEPYMSSTKDNAQRIFYELSGFNGFNLTNSWKAIGERIVEFDEFGAQLRRKLSGEDVLLARVKSLKTTDEKIAAIFNEVKNSMKWNDIDQRYTTDGTVVAWDKKIGNSTEVNLILYHLLMRAGIKAYPMLVSAKNNGKVNPAYPSMYQFNKTVAYIPIDTANYYILDATNKYGSYKTIPAALLNSYGFFIDRENKGHDLIFMEQKQSVRQVVSIDAEIKPDAKMIGTAVLNDVSHDRINAVEKYKTDGEKKYMDYLRNDDNNLKISSIKFNNLDIDTLPLVQNINFSLDLTGSDGGYIYFSPNLFTSMRRNPFLSEKRTTDIFFGYPRDYQITGNYKIPAGYKVEALPKNITFTMPDKSIIFKRIIGEQDGSVVVMYVVSHKSSFYFKDDYPDFREFYKKMHEMLNEQIVLKKS